MHCKDIVSLRPAEPNTPNDSGPSKKEKRGGKSFSRSTKVIRDGSAAKSRIKRELAANRALENARILPLP